MDDVNGLKKMENAKKNDRKEQIPRPLNKTGDQDDSQRIKSVLRKAHRRVLAMGRVQKGNVASKQKTEALGKERNDTLN